MFWGDGDTGRLGPKEVATLTHLRRLAETGHIRALSPKESETAIEAINFYATLRAAQSFVVGLRNILLLVGGLLGIWWAMQEGVVDLIQKVISGTVTGG